MDVAGRAAPAQRGFDRVRAAVAAGAALAAASLGLASTASAFTPEEIAAFQQAIQDEQARGQYPGFMVGVFTPDQGQFVHAVGVADTTTGAPLETTQPSRIGSNTKTFTGTLIMQLVERGRIGLHDPVSDYVRGIPRGRKMTIEELLTHTSGLADLSPLVDLNLTVHPERNYTPMQSIRWGVGQARVCPPGKCWSYSNVGFMLLGRIAEKVTGRSLDHLYRARIIDPLGLSDTDFRPGTQVPAGIAHGYEEVTPGAGFQDTTNWSFSYTWAAGAMVSTIADLHTYVDALATGHGLLDKRTQRERLRFVKTTVPHVRYGLGIAKVGGCLGHNGEVPGYDSIMLYCPADGATIITMGNTAESLDNFGEGKLPDPDLFGIARELRAIVDAG